MVNVGGWRPSLFWAWRLCSSDMETNDVSSVLKVLLLVVDELEACEVVKVKRASTTSWEAWIHLSRAEGSRDV